MKSSKAILSASRMSDMPKYYPEDIIRECRTRFEKGVEAHTLVLWTKHPDALLAEPLNGFLKDLARSGVQIFIELTVTGMGSKIIGTNRSGAWKIEPNAPPCEKSLELLPEIIGLVGSAQRIKIRIDPLIKVKDFAGTLYSNVPLFDPILARCAAAGIVNFTFSFLEPGFHAKVDRRFKAMGCEISAFTEAERLIFAEHLKHLESVHKVKFYACCVNGFEESACIDGRLLRELHPQKMPCDLNELRRRPKCGCVKSIDLGGWPVKKCFTGCDYCYANPAYL